MSATNGTNETMEIRELFARIDAAAQQMSVNNPHRTLLVQCKVAIGYLVQMIPDGNLLHRGRIIIP